MEEIEKFFICPYCGESISMMFDISAGAQQYIEDCEICCCPIEIKFSVNEGFIESLKVFRIDV